MNIFDTFFCTSSVEAPKLQRSPNTFVPFYGEDSIAERTAQKMVVVVHLMGYGGDCPV
jgi:hypothetical protein